jgi:hypothetical protein
MARLAESGVVGFSDDGSPVADAELDRWRDTLRQDIARLSELLP